MNPQIKFTCPTCGENRLVENRSQVDIKTDVVGFFIFKNPITNRNSYNVEQGNECGRSDGKITGYCCDACGFTLRTSPRRQWWNDTMGKANPITSRTGLYLWLRRNKMIEESDAVATIR